MDDDLKLSRERRLVLWLLVFASIGFALYLLRAALLPFVVGMAVAYLLDPLADRLERLGCPRGLAAFAIVLTFLLVIAVALVVLVPVLSDQVTGLISHVPEYIDTLRRESAPFLRRIRSHLTPGQAKQIDEAIQSHAGDVLSWAGQILGSIITGGAAVLSVLGLMFIMPVVAFYMIRDWDRIIAYLNSLLPLHGGETVRTLLIEIDDRLSGFVRGQALVCLLLGVWYATGLTLVGLDFALLLGIGAGILSIIPYVGNIVGLSTSVLLAFAQFDTWLGPALVVAVFLSGQVLEGNFVTPKIVGDRVGLHPVWLLFAVTAGGTLLGITGALLAVPVAAALGVVVRYAVRRYQQSALYREGATRAGVTKPGIEPRPGPDAGFGGSE